MKRVVAIDGPSGAGKSTVAKAVAEALGFRYLDTGALYRAIGLGLRGAGITEQSSDADISKALAGISVSFHEGRVLLNNKDVSTDIRTTEAGHYSSVFSARRPVRDFLMPVQREASEHDDLVAEGRDMGTVVFPSAWRKFYLVASVEARAKRRYDQLKDKIADMDMAKAERDVVDRDKRDSERDIAPLRQAQDAVLIDSSLMSAKQVIEQILQLSRGSANA